jgi:hypothetical protein
MLVVGGTAIGSSLLQGKAAGKAADIQAGASQEGIEEQRRQFDISTVLSQQAVEEQRKQYAEFQKLLAPYIQSGTQALTGFGAYQAAGLGAVPTLERFAATGVVALEEQQAIAGLLGPERQRQAIAKIEQGGGYQAQVQAGEKAILQQASATGGLRGGNIQLALGQYRPALLQQAIENQYARLGGLTELGGQTAQNLATSGQGATEFLTRSGQAAAAGQAAGGASSAGRIGDIYGAQSQAGQVSATNIANLLGQAGAARAGGELGEAKAYSQILGLPGQILGFQAGAGGKAGPVGFGNLFSDIRLKKNIKKLNRRSDGLNVYEFEYIWGGGRQIGLMAHEVQSVYPDAISESGGYLMVNYSKV